MQLYPKNEILGNLEPRKKVIPNYSTVCGADECRLNFWYHTPCTLLWNKSPKDNFSLRK